MIFGRNLKSLLFISLNVQCFSHIFIFPDSNQMFAFRELSNNYIIYPETNSFLDPLRPCIV